MSAQFLLYAPMVFSFDFQAQISIDLPDLESTEIVDLAPNQLYSLNISFTVPLMSSLNAYFYAETPFNESAAMTVHHVELV